MRRRELPHTLLVDPGVRRQDRASTMLALDHQVVGFLVPRYRRIVAIDAYLDITDIPLGSLVVYRIGGILLQLGVVLPCSPTSAHRVIVGVVRLHPRPVLPGHVGFP